MIMTMGGSGASDSINTGKWIALVLNMAVAGALGGVLLFEPGLDPLVRWCTGDTVGAKDVARALFQRHHRATRGVDMHERLLSEESSSSSDEAN